jgi:glycosyltransferase involved in cell wall biosynthesis
MQKCGIVVIGRNEAARLEACLRSLPKQEGVELLYVDSGSTDQSIQIAENLAIPVLNLDALSGFSAARARNEGAKWLLERHPEICYLQFLDGDCVLNNHWIKNATDFLSTNLACDLVLGQLKEQSPDASIYNMLCALEWRSPSGTITGCGAVGGLFMVRASTFFALDGFNQQVIAGEDSEFAVRIQLRGAQCYKLDLPMATHDAAIFRFGQWWKRAKRSGHAIAQRFFLNGGPPVYDCRKELRGLVFWGLFLPCLAAALTAIAGWAGPLLLFIGLSYLGARIFHFRRRFGDSSNEAFAYAFFNVLAKPAQISGMLLFFRNQLLKRFDLIEYK